MELVHGLENWKPVKNPVVTVGSFDGVHAAHKCIIGLLKHEAELIRGNSVLITFSPHPRLVLHSFDAYAQRFGLLSTDAEKTELLAKAGLDVLVMVRFDEEFSKIPYSGFIEKILVEKIGVKKMVVGYNHNFGHNREGSYEQMLDYGRRYGFAVDRFPEQVVQKQHVSSTRIRQLLEDGNVAQANELLGYAYGLSGVYRNGACLVSDPHKLLPGAGSYLVKVKNGAKFNFTVAQLDERLALPDLHTLAEGEEIRLSFIKRLHLYA
ncbi:MAG: FAD synthetase family protein [Bacteroides sp.]|nr:FAD synthetase family protein [Bacteroides sp.]MCM1085307.1 FAD synthetase family protein [Bacteroides sp.]MCM1169855.1 FAD synthetase family protein [Bacteroides sp.]MCM1532198.1 FAD synthetase family protein [Ruminococcus flavefaciens]MCM1555360.1 FAD synthetase family protein [Bacteroides sp.]